MLNSLSQPIFILLGIFAFGFAVTKSPQIITSLIGGNTAMSDSIGNLMSFGMATNLAKIGGKFAWKSGKFAVRNAVGKPIGLTQGISRVMKSGTPLKKQQQELYLVVLTLIQVVLRVHLRVKQLKPKIKLWQI